MIAIGKYLNLGKSLFDFNPLSAADAAAFQDKILINYLPKEDMPYFDMTTESDDGSIGKKQIGEFAIKLSFAQSETSAEGFNIKDFFRDTEHAYKYFFAMEVNGAYYVGIFESHHIKFNYTYSKGRLDVGFMVRDIKQEFRVHLETMHTEFSGISHTTILTWEQYMRDYHLGEYTLIMPISNWSTRTADIFNRFRGDTYRDLSDQTGYTIWAAESRLKTFRDLYTSHGFDFDIVPNGGVQYLYDNMGTGVDLKSLIKIKLFWLRDLINETPVDITWVDHSEEEILPAATKKHIFMSVYEAVYEFEDAIQNFYQLNQGESLTGIRGVLMTGESDEFSDPEIKLADRGDTIFNDGRRVNFPFFMRTNGNIIVTPVDYNDSSYVSYVETSNGLLNQPVPFPVEDNGFLEEEILQLELGQYSAPNNWTGGTSGGLGTGFNKAGAVGYAVMFQNEDHSYAKGIKYGMLSYERYLSGGGKKKRKIGMMLSDFPAIHVYKTCTIEDETYYVSRITKLAHQSNRVEFEAIEL